jgi:2-amino-4-hydroxy-6-hydroxymethyldihydropteridine diphosphokinase
MPDVLVGVGSNADPVRGLKLAVAELERQFGELRCSSVYRSASVGIPGPDYLDMVVAFVTSEPVVALRDVLRAIEERAGRRRGDPKTCALDLDLLCYGVCVDAAQRLPRPGMLEQVFVLAPLAEVAPDFTDPLTGRKSRVARQAAAARAAIENVGSLKALR